MNQALKSLYLISPQSGGFFTKDDGHAFSAEPPFGVPEGSSVRIGNVRQVLDRPCELAGGVTANPDDVFEPLTVTMAFSTGVTVRP